MLKNYWVKNPTFGNLLLCFVHHYKANMRSSIHASIEWYKNNSDLRKPSFLSLCWARALNKDLLGTIGSIVSANVCLGFKKSNTFHHHWNEDLVVKVLYHNVGFFKPNLLLDALHSPIPKVQHLCQHIVGSHIFIKGNMERQKALQAKHCFPYHLCIKDFQFWIKIFTLQGGNTCCPTRVFPTKL